MSMSDCIKCWDTPCTCGWDYKEWGTERLDSHIHMLEKVKAFRLKYPEATYSRDNTEYEILFLEAMRK